MQKGFAKIFILAFLVLVIIFLVVGVFTFLKSKKDNSIFQDQYNLPIISKDRGDSIKQEKICVQVITPAKNNKTGECKDFSTPCDVPEGWEKVGSCATIPTDETANWKTFAVEKFSFKFPRSMYIQRKEQNEVVWKMDYTPGTFTYNAMILKSQNKPFSKLQVGDSYSIYVRGEESSKEVKSKITNIDESQEISLGGKKAFRSTFGCGVDCYFHVLYFEYESKYYELLFNGAGGGLIKIFDQIITTFKFLE